MNNIEVKCHTWSATEWAAHYGGPKAKLDVLSIAIQSLNASVCEVQIGNTSPMVNIPDGCRMVVLQHPTRGLTAPSRDAFSIPNLRFLRDWTQSSQWKVLVIHDLKSLQSTLFNGFDKEMSVAEWYERERILVEAASVIITHTQSMSRKILEMYPSVGARMVSLSLFDYLCESDQDTSWSFLPTNLNESITKIAFCGNLNASSLFGEMIKDLPQAPSLEYHLFSPTWGMPKQISRQDMVIHLEEHASRLPGVVRGMGCSFGLCWWANAVMQSEYLSLIAPHKASCYLAAGVPLIAPMGTYIGDFVTEQGLGVTISSLSEISELVSSISPSALHSMSLNVAKYSSKVRSGHFTRNALLASLPIESL
jgi:hypothetical protein